MLMVLNSTIGSSIPSGASHQLQADFNITNEYLLVLPVSVFLIGYILGPMIFAPLSEHYGRKIVMISTFLVFTAFILGCALAPTFPALVVMRLIVGIGASTPVSVIGGIYADIYDTPRGRGTAVASFMAATTWGPVCGPTVSGYMATVSWRWVFWVELIFAGVTWPFLLLMPETFGPVLLRRRAKKLRKDTGDEKIFAPNELEKQDLWELCSMVLTRPIRMFLFEAIVLCSCLYLSLAYGIFYSKLYRLAMIRMLALTALASILPSIPHHLRRHIWFQRRTDWSYAVAHRSRFDHCRWPVPMVGLLPGQDEAQTAASGLVAERGVSAAASRSTGRTFVCEWIAMS